MITLKPTTETLISENYPYGYSLRTTKEDWIEFNPKKGFRHVSRTINPKSGRWNKEKKGTYHMFMLLGRDENNHVKTLSFGDFYDYEGANKILALMEANKHLFEDPHLKYFYDSYILFMFVSLQAMVVYCGANIEAAKEVFMSFVKLAKDKPPFTELTLPIEKIEALKDPNFKPFG